MNTSQEEKKQIAKMFAQDTGEAEKIQAVMDAAFGDKRNFYPLTEKKPSHCVVLDAHGDIVFSVSIGEKYGFFDFSSAKYFCNQHIMSCVNDGVMGAARWRVRPAFVSIK